MTPILLTLLILSAPPKASIGGPASLEVLEIFKADFEAESDADFDSWPDGWQRQRGPGYPRYVRVRLAKDTDGGNQAVRVDLDGGAAALFSPTIPIGSEFSYIVEGRIRTAGIRRDEAYLSVELLDSQRRRVGFFTSDRLRGDNDWVKVRLGPISTPSSEASTAILGLHVAPGAGQDINGTVWFDDLRLGRLPLINLETSLPSHLYVAAGEVEIVCRASGVQGVKSALHFTLEDPHGEIVAQTERQLEEAVAGGGGPAARNAVALRWRPNITAPGFYRAKVTLLGRDETIVSRETTLAVLPAAVMPAKGEFGWSLPHGEGPVPLAALPPLLAQAGVNWIKFPIWLPGDDDRRASDVAILDERLQSQHIEVIGVLDEPPASIRGRFGESSRLLAADVFSQSPDLWNASLEPAMTALSMQVRWWQLGRDNDTSFVGYPDLRQRVETVEKQLEQFGAQVKLALSWGWINELPAQNRAPWRALNLSAQPALTAEELTDHLKSLSNTEVARWVMLEPLARGDYGPDARASDLVRRILAAKIGGAEGIFIPDPFDANHGLLNPDGTPGELLLPWRTAATSLAGARHLGSVDLEGGSHNEVFARDRDAVMVIWNESPRREQLYLGENVFVTDLWGRSMAAERQDDRHVIQAGPLPTFVTGIEEPIIRIAMQAGFANRQLPSVPGVAHVNPLEFRNYFPRGAGGKIKIVAPEGWVVDPPAVDFKLAAGEDLRHPVRITLPFSANSGPQPVTLEFELNAGRKHAFSIRRRMDVGFGDVFLEISTQLNEKQELVVEQRITNNTDSFVSFKCELSAPNRRLMRTQVFELGRGVDTQQYVIPSGQDLVGQSIWLRAVEIGGPRQLSQRHVVKP